LLCDEGLALVKLPRKKWLPLVLWAGFRAGVAHLPTVVERDRWPLDSSKPDVGFDDAWLLPRERLKRLVVKRHWFIPSEIIVAADHGNWRLGIAAAKSIREYERLLAAYATTAA
jgi:hypothetical protein